MPQSDTTLARVRLLVLRGLPLLVLDLLPPSEAPGGRDVQRELLERGFELLPAAYGIELPRRARVAVTLREGALVLEDDEEVGLLRIPGPDPDWLASARRKRGALVYAGAGLSLTPDTGAQHVRERLEEAAREGRLAGSIVSFAEPDTVPPF